MSALMAVLFLVTAQAPATVRFERVDVLSEDPGLWLYQDAGRLGVDALTPTIRFLSQVKPVFSLPVEELSVGVSLGSQSLVYERALLESIHLSWTVGLQTRLLLPRGALVGLAWRVGPLRLGLSLSVFSEASWANVDYRSWTALPTFGLGIGRSVDLALRR